LTESLASPVRFNELVHEAVRFSTFFPVTVAIKRGIFKIVSHQDIASHNTVFPIFRSGLADPKAKKVFMWWFWDGEKAWK
jgi:hypothetical protein